MRIVRLASPVVRRFLRTPSRMAVASFLAAIMVGTGVLCLPISSQSRQWTSPVDALFTATSSVCVTGLIVKDTPVYWSLFGQIAILTMIQIGGLGIMTLYAFLAAILRRRSSMGFERMMGNVVEGRPQESARGHIKFICLLTLFAETVGAVCLYFSWGDDFTGAGTAERIYHSIFHAISAFCNAGFSLNVDSLQAYAGNVPVNAVICSLILLGGVGFLVVRDLKDCAVWWLFRRTGRRPRLSTHSKLVLTVSAVLLLLGFVAMFVMESSKSGPADTLRERVLTAVFQAVTPRTAGFNTIRFDAAQLAPATALLLMALMFIGGSPGSTAGGIKTSTVGVMIASIVATLRGREQAEVFHHSVRQDTVHRVASVILLGITTLAVGTFFLLITERGASFQEVAFEATSAFGTVGLSLGLTQELSTLGRLIVPVLMFVGRLGPITIVLSAATMAGTARYQYPPGRILVG